ncbi:MAG: pyridoxal phosphate-dependent aminotransferase [Candidatus Omnitrophica bacterium]|nr:pyridoxal phosphate-dependent aminotransferase [Candidatus Omnitrophota bacterium]
MKLSEKIKKIAPSATLEITSKAKALRASGEDVVILAAGEPDFDTPQIIKDAALKALDSGYTKYTPAAGSVSLKKAICQKLKKDNGLEYSPNEVIVSNGAKHSIYNILQVLCSDGDEVLIIPPFWLSYPEMVKLAGATPVKLSMRKDNFFKVDPNDLERAITSKTRVLILNSPSNPTGVIYDKDELKAIAEICVKNKIMIISDEIYEKIIFDGNEHFSIAEVSPEAKEATIVINGVSKSHSMTGWRIGYAAGDKDVIKLASTLQSHATSGPCSISQVAAECAILSDLEDVMDKNRETFQQRRDVLIEGFSGEDKIKPFKPLGAFYLFCDISKCGVDSMTFSKDLLEEKNVAVIPGGPFGDDSAVRISFATDIETIQMGIDRIKEWVKKF